jgi:hypothetical protein
MNAGASAATGDVLLFLHADTTLPAGAVAGVRGALSDARTVLVGHIPSIEVPGRRFHLLSFNNWAKTFYAPILFQPENYVRGLRILFGDQASASCLSQTSEPSTASPLAINPTKRTHPPRRRWRAARPTSDPSAASTPRCQSWRMRSCACGCIERARAQPHVLRLVRNPLLLLLLLLPPLRPKPQTPLPLLPRTQQTQAPAAAAAVETPPRSTRARAPGAGACVCCRAPQR